jgi:hypothetical protein
MQSSVIAIKEKLHQRIESIDDEKVLQAFYAILENYKNEAGAYELRDEQWNEVKDREADYLSGKDKGISLEEHIEMTKDKYGFKS